MAVRTTWLLLAATVASIHGQSVKAARLPVAFCTPAYFHALGVRHGRLPRAASSCGLPIGMKASSAQVERVQAALTSAPAILAPLTRGGNLPFRILCAELCQELGTARGNDSNDSASCRTVALPTVSEMIYAKFLLKGDPTEKARLRFSAQLEPMFGVQLATNRIEEGVAAAALVSQAGASFVDLNCGCPIYDATRRGVGAALLRRPDKLARLVREMAEGSPLPLTVKVRTGPGNEGSENVLELVQCLAETRAVTALTVHGRTQQQRYTRPANWDLIQQAAVLASASAGRGPGESMVLVGNGDVLTHYEAAARRDAAPAVRGLMIGRGALIKPWIFGELVSQRTWCPSAPERIRVYHRLSVLMKQHFGADALGKQRMMSFLPWHLDFLSRWRPLPSALFIDLSRTTPLLQAGRDVDKILRDSGEHVTRLEQLLRCRHPDAHAAIASMLWQAHSAEAAVGGLEALTGEQLTEWDAQVAGDDGVSSSRVRGAGSARSDDETEGQSYVQVRETGAKSGGGEARPRRRAAAGSSKADPNSKRQLKKRAQQAKLPSEYYGQEVQAQGQVVRDLKARLAAGDEGVSQQLVDEAVQELIRLKQSFRFRI